MLDTIVLVDAPIHLRLVHVERTVLMEFDAGDVQFVFVLFVCGYRGRGWMVSVISVVSIIMSRYEFTKMSFLLCFQLASIAGRGTGALFRFSSRLSHPCGNV